MHIFRIRKFRVLPKNFTWHLCQYEHTLRICSYCQGCLLLQLKSSVTVVSSALGTCTLYHWTHTGSIIIIKQSQPGTTTVPILHGCSRSRYKPVMAYLRFGAMRSCFGRPTKSSYSVNVSLL